MADTVKKVDYFAVTVPNRRGEAARILESLSKSGVNLLAFSGFPSGGGRSQVDFIPVKTPAFRVAARRAGLRLKQKKTGFHIQGGDRPGALARILKKLADIKINVTAVDAACAGKGRYGAILWVKAKDVRKAAKALRAK
jgi:hypothetical protein